MKRLLPTFLLILISFGIFGYFPISVLFLNYSKSAAKSSIRHPRESEKFVFENLQNNKEITWESDGKEFCYKGVMYDVVQINAYHSSKRYYCYRDKLETSILSHIRALLYVQYDNDRDESNMLRIMMLLAQIFIPSYIVFLFLKPTILNGIRKSGHYQFLYSQYYPDSSLRPPCLLTDATSKHLNAY